MKYLLMLGLFFALGHTSLHAQLRAIPQEVKEAFGRQYPQAEAVRYEDKLLYVNVYFKKGQSSSCARYSSKGAWQFTETGMDFSSLPASVQDGFNKSKYLDWKVDHSYLVDLPGGKHQYKLQVEKSPVAKRNLLFNERGRLLSDNLTMY